MNIINLFPLIIANSLFIFGIKAATNYDIEVTEDKEKIIDKMVLWRLRYWSIKHLGYYWSKPLFLCASCMSSVWGLIFFWSFIPFTLNNLYICFFYIPMLAGFNYGLSKYID